ncbi:MAG: AMP-binding protein [Methylocella sp.]
MTPPPLCPRSLCRRCSRPRSPEPAAPGVSPHRTGISPESPVGIALERSAEMVVALLAILKAGAAYLPLDLEYPAERLRFMLKDSSTKLLLTTSTIAEHLTSRGDESNNTPTLLLDDPATVAELGGHPNTAPTDNDRTLPLNPTALRNTPMIFRFFPQRSRPNAAHGAT